MTLIKGTGGSITRTIIFTLGYTDAELFYAPVKFARLLIRRSVIFDLIKKPRVILTVQYALLKN